ncbi:hypothetical protein GGR51DRAFT_575187 [Nemania sp. FL0031]|nr:hypothetical protein GGR51DRAFT_575187 [Nemania sp. FL0031]
MPTHIEEHDERSPERSRKRRRVSVELEETDSFKRQRLSKVNLRKCPRISRDEHFKAWLADAGRPLRSHDNMSQLPSPAVTTQNFNRTSTVSAARTVVSARDSDYREHLTRFNIHIGGVPPPPGLKKEVTNMVFRRRDSPEPDDAFVEHVKEELKNLERQPEEDIRTLSISVIPGCGKPSDKRLTALNGQLWNQAVAVPHDPIFEKPPLPLPKPKPDTTFSFSQDAFSRAQLSTTDFLVQTQNGLSFASPHSKLLFPFASVEYKSLDGSLAVAANQGVGTAAVALNGYLELMSRGPGLDDADLNKVLFFLVTMDPKLACISMIWVGKTPDTNQYSFHLEELDALSLSGIGDGIRRLICALKNIQDYAVDTILGRLTSALDAYYDNKIKNGNAGSTEEPQAIVESPTPPPVRPLRNKRAKKPTSKAGKKTTGMRTRPKKNKHTQAEAQRVGVRTRRATRLEVAQ